MSTSSRSAGLGVWLDDVHVAELIEKRSRQLVLRYTDDTIATYGVNAVVLSASLPVRPEPYSVGSTRPFLEGILPEGEARTRIEHELAIPRGDTFKLLAAIGRDCAGAVVILPQGVMPVRDTGSLRGLTTGELAVRVSALPERPLGIFGDVRLSLAGVMNKLLLTKVGDTWADPVGGAPSTHILKPEPPRYPGLAILEAYGLALAQACGLSAANAEVIELALEDGPTMALLVERYDRIGNAEGTVRRIHQEDMCQALGRLEKYQAEGGPAWGEIALLLRTVSTDPRGDLARLARAMTLNAAIGNADAHGRNLSMLYDRSRRVLAPLYDVIPTLAVRPRSGERPLTQTMSMTIGRVAQLDDVRGSDLLDEAIAWRLPSKIARNEIAFVLEQLEKNADTVADVLPGPASVPDHAVEMVRQRAINLFNTM